VLCGPGNNGGDGYVAARHLAAMGIPVRVAALADPKSEPARWARSKFDGESERLSERTEPAPMVIDCLFGTGLKKAGG
jgi:ADP-dependent NAD(P)H-hydrate dehydratase / NAD(P)H-hydrate epimerase